jgi:hypothetical protein
MTLMSGPIEMITGILSPIASGRTFKVAGEYSNR